MTDTQDTDLDLYETEDQYADEPSVYEQVREIVEESMIQIVQDWNAEKEEPIELEFSDTEDYMARTDVAIHLYKPTESRLIGALEQAQRDNHNLIVVYL